MNVNELIKHLSAFNPETTVWISDSPSKHRGSCIGGQVADVSEVCGFEYTFNNGQSAKHGAVIISYEGKK